jgi:YD repeat-containing protein
MPLLTIRHKTAYRYRNPVALGEHRLMLRPRKGHDIAIVSERLAIDPEPVSLRWIYDAFGNSVAIVRFAGRTTRLDVESTITVDQHPAMVAFPPAQGAEAGTYPFRYDADEMPDLAPLVARHYPDPDGRIEAWARQFVGREPVSIHGLLCALTHGVRAQFAYRRRTEHGVQAPLETLTLGSGTCRDFAQFMVEAARALGFAARFVSGYIHVPKRNVSTARGGGATHAWAQVYLPQDGWVDFDPTNGIVGSRDLIRVAVAREPGQAVPLWGTWTGFPSDHLGMTVEVDVSAPAGEHDEDAVGQCA